MRLIKQNTRHFAKRQLTWFRREPETIWVEKEQFGYDEERMLAYMRQTCQEKGFSQGRRKKGRRDRQRKNREKEDRTDGEERERTGAHRGRKPGDVSGNVPRDGNFPGGAGLRRGNPGRARRPLPGYRQDGGIQSAEGAARDAAAPGERGTFAATSGYGYNDMGRDTLEEVYADVFHTEAALVRPQITCGTHALTVALHGNLRPGDEPSEHIRQALRHPGGGYRHTPFLRLPGRVRHHLPAGGFEGGRKL